MSSPHAPLPDMLTPSNVFSSSAHTMAARASVTPLISMCPSSNGWSTCGTKVSPSLSPKTGCLALFCTTRRAPAWISARPQSMVQARAVQPCPSASNQIPPHFGWESPHHGPHSLCCAPLGCLSRFSANAGGGATAHFLEYGSLDKTAIRGRWSSTKTARIYINEAVSTLAQITHTALQQTAIDKYAKIILQPNIC